MNLEQQVSLGRYLTAVICGAAVLFGARAASAITYTVNTLNDTVDANHYDNSVCADSAGKCSLRAAIETTNIHPGYDAIVLPAGTYLLSMGELVVWGDLDILGSGGTNTKIDAGSHGRVLQVSVPTSSLVGLYDLTLQHGLTDVGFPGAGVYVKTGALYGYWLVIDRNNSSAGLGGGAYVAGRFTCDHCTIKCNHAGEDTGGTQHTGGGLYNEGTTTLTASTISGNKAGRGGGIAGAGILDVRNCTISGNEAAAGGGGLRTNNSTADWDIAWTTITGNTAHPSTVEAGLGGGILHAAGKLNVGKTLIVNNADSRTSSDANSSPDCATTSSSVAPFVKNKSFNTYWDNIVGNLGKVCGSVSPDGDDPSYYDVWGTPTAPLTNHGVDPTLQNNGGLSWTHRLLAGGLAINFAIMGNPVPSNTLFNNPTTDQTDATRPKGGGYDSGSYEYR